MTLLSMAQVRERIPVSRPTIYALIEARSFPRPVKIAGKGNRSFWAVSDVEAWLQANPGAGA